jgi:protein-tyrosine phosphatase
MSDTIGVLFVCLGNICRSPLAEGVFRAVARDAGVEHRFHIDSAGTTSYHTGSPPDPRTLAVGRRRGVELDHQARQIQPSDFDRFQHIIVMDSSNLARVRRVAERAGADHEVVLLRSFDPEADGETEVPDPYFGGVDGFEEVHEMVERACAALLDHLLEQHPDAT